MKPKHSPEPWVADGTLVLRSGTEAELVAECHDGGEEDAARIAACGNACVGISDPKVAIDEARDFAEDMASGRCYCEDAPEGEHGKIVCDSCRGKAILALLGGAR